MKKKEQERTPETAAIAKKFRRQLILTVISAVISLGVIAGATAAWFANNRTVESSGMQIQVESSSNLVIAKEDKAFTDNQFKVTFDAPNSVPLLFPARHSESEVTITGTDAVGLYYNTNPQDVSMEKGLKKGSNNLSFAYVPQSDDSPYYVDYTVYLAASGREFTANSLTATLTLSPAADAAHQYMNAATIDFYVNGSYAQTLNAAGLDWENSGTALASVELLSTNKGFKLHTDTASLVPVLMRCYFDGGLLVGGTGDTTYVHTQGLEKQDFTMSVAFTATDAPQS